MEHRLPEPEQGRLMAEHSA